MAFHHSSSIRCVHILFRYLPCSVWIWLTLDLLCLCLVNRCWTLTFFRSFASGKLAINLGQQNWLVVSTHLKNISQMGNHSQVGEKIKNIWNHHLEKHETIPWQGHNRTHTHTHTPDLIPPLECVCWRSEHTHFELPGDWGNFNVQRQRQWWWW